MAVGSLWSAVEVVGVGARGRGLLEGRNKGGGRARREERLLVLVDALDEVGAGGGGTWRRAPGPKSCHGGRFASEVRVLGLREVGAALCLVPCGAFGGPLTSSCASSGTCPLDFRSPIFCAKKPRRCSPLPGRSPASPSALNMLAAPTT